MVIRSTLSFVFISALILIWAAPGHAQAPGNDEVACNETSPNRTQTYGHENRFNVLVKLSDVHFRMGNLEKERQYRELVYGALGR